MARKSSFLQGFEVGSDLYNKGFSQAATMRQMSMQEARDKAAAERHAADAKRAERLDKLAEDRHNLLKEKLEDERAESKRVRKEREKEKQKEQSALNGFMRMREMYHDQPSEEAKVDFFMRNRGEIETSLAGTKHWRSYEVWRQSEVYENATYKLKSQLNANQAEAAMSGARAELIRTENAKLIAKQYQAITGENLNPFDPNEVARAQTVIWDADVRGFAVQHGVTLPADYQIGDFNEDGKLDSRDLMAAKSDVLRMKSDLAKTQNEAKRERDWQYEKQKLDYAAALKIKQTQAEEAIKNMGMAAVGSPAYNESIRSIALSGQAITDLKNVLQPRQIQAVMDFRSDVRKRMSNDKTLTSVELAAMSAIFSKEPEQTFVERVDKALTVRGQIKTLGQFMGAVETGPLEAKIKTLKKYWGSEEGKDTAKLEGILNAIIPNLARGIYGEVGVLTDSDIQNYKKTFVSIENPEEVNKLLFRVTQDMVDRSIGSQLEAAARGGRNVSGFVPTLSEVSGDPIPFLHGEGRPDEGRPADGPIHPITGVPLNPQAMNSKMFNMNEDMGSEKDAVVRVTMNAIRTGNFSPVIVTVGGASREVPPDEKLARKIYKEPHAHKDWIQANGEVQPFIHENTHRKFNTVKVTPDSSEGEPTDAPSTTPEETNPEEAEPKPQAKGEEYSWDIRSDAAYQLANPSKWGGHFSEQQHRKIEGYNNPIKFSLDMKKDGVIISEILPDGKSQTRRMPWREFNELIPLNRETSWLLEGQ